MLARSKLLLERLGNPQNTHKTIHVAGTSGKGTVCYMIDAILRAHNKQTSLLVSPHVYDIRERVQINNQYAPEKKYIDAANLVIRQAKEMSNSGDAPSYFEVMTAIGFLLSSQKSLDYIVVETGMGGKYDLSNTIYGKPKYCVLTQIGLDHTRLLGTTYEQIALEKSEIMQSGSGVTALEQKDTVNKVFMRTAEKYGLEISWVKPYGQYEVDDLLIALDATRNIASRDSWQFNEEIASEAAQKIYIPGRFEKRSIGDHLVILDGAHNPQKLAALSDRLQREELSPATFLIALGEHSDVEKSLIEIREACKLLIICEFFLEHKSIPRHALSSEVIYETAKKLNFSDIQIVKSPLAALNTALEFSEIVVVTGSFYLLGEVDAAF